MSTNIDAASVEALASKLSIIADATGITACAEAADMLRAMRAKLDAAPDNSTRYFNFGDSFCDNKWVCQVPGYYQISCTNITPVYRDITLKETP